HLDQVAAVDGDVVGRAAGEQHGPGVRGRQRRPHPVAVGRAPGGQAAEDGGRVGQFGRHHSAGGAVVIDHGRISLASYTTALNRSLAQQVVSSTARWRGGGS